MAISATSITIELWRIRNWTIREASPSRAVKVCVPSTVIVCSIASAIAASSSMFSPLTSTSDLAIPHNDDAVGRTDQLGQVGGNHDYSQTSAGDLIASFIDFGFCANIDAACRFIENQHFQIRGDPFSQRHFLLIATRQGGHSQIAAQRLDTKRLDKSIRHQRLSAVRSRIPPRSVFILRRNMMFSLIDRSSSTPCPLRSSGTISSRYARPCREAVLRTVRPLRRTSPATARSAPNMARIVSVRPEPIEP